MEIVTAIVLGLSLTCVIANILMVWLIIRTRRKHIHRPQSADDQESQSQSHEEHPSNSPAQDSQQSLFSQGVDAENSESSNAAPPSTHVPKTAENPSNTVGNEGQVYEKRHFPGARLASIPEESSSQTIGIAAPPPLSQQDQHAQTSRIPRRHVPASIPWKTSSE